jgi:hypothetical protein
MSTRKTRANSLIFCNPITCQKDKGTLMAINKIKPLTFKHLKPAEKEQHINDGGGLYIRVRSITDGGGVVFRFRYRFDGKQRWLSLKASDLVEARKERDSYRQMLKVGIDPNLERTLQIERIRQKQLDEQEVLAKLQARVTVNDLFIRWRDTNLISRKDKVEIVRMFNKDVLPVLGDLFVEDVAKVAYSGSKLPLIPDECCHRFHFKAATDSG